MPLQMNAEFEVLTPMFLGGAHGEAELRPPSFRGLLRFWLRAVDPQFRKWEPRLFGGTAQGSGQSAVLVRLDQVQAFKPLTWDQLQVRQFNVGRERATRNGLIYLGYPFQMSGRGPKRTAVPPGHRFTLRFLLPRIGKDTPVEDSENLRRRLVAAIWLLGHFGSAGTRARRGFGGLALRSWQGIRGDWPELAEDVLPLLHRTAAARLARIEIDRALARFDAWFGIWKGDDAGPSTPDHPHLGPAFGHKLSDTAVRRAEWGTALAAMGAHMQEFRLAGEPDSGAVKQQLQAEAGRGGRPLQRAPSRATFGLPLTFRYPNMRPGTITFVPYLRNARKAPERQGSLLLLRVLLLGDGLHSLFLRLDGAVPGYTPLCAPRGAGRPLRAPAENAMDRFFDSLPDGG